MKILMCVNALSSDGPEVFAARLAIALRRAGCEVRLFSYRGVIDGDGKTMEAALAREGVPHDSPCIHKNHLKPFVPLHVARALSEFQPDICHSHLEESDFFVWLGSMLPPSKTTFLRTIHNAYAPSLFPGFIHRRLANAYRASVACGQAVLEQYPYLGGNGRVINYGIDLAGFVPQRPTAEIRAQLGVGEKTPLLVNTGFFSVGDGKLQKSQDIIVRAMAKVSARDYVVAFVGDGERRREIEDLARSLGVAARCRFVGRVLNRADYMFAADGILMPSRFESLAIGCFQAACSAKPVIVSNIAAFAPFARPSTIFVAPESVEELAAAMERLLGKLDHFRGLAAQQQAYYRAEFDMNAVAARYLDCYKELLNAEAVRKSAVSCSVAMIYKTNVWRYVTTAILGIFGCE